MIRFCTGTISGTCTRNFPKIFSKLLQKSLRSCTRNFPGKVPENFAVNCGVQFEFLPLIFSLGVRVARGRSFTGNACAAFRVVLLSGYCCRIVKPKDVLVIFTTVNGEEIRYSLFTLSGEAD